MLAGDGLAELLVAGEHDGKGQARQPPQRPQGRQLQALQQQQQQQHGDKIGQTNQPIKKSRN